MNQVYLASGRREQSFVVSSSSNVLCVSIHDVHTYCDCIVLFMQVHLQALSVFQACRNTWTQTETHYWEPGSVAAVWRECSFIKQVFSVDGKLSFNVLTYVRTLLKCESPSPPSLSLVPRPNRHFISIEAERV